MKRFSSFVLSITLIVGGCCVERNPDTGVSVTSYVETITKIRSNIAAIRTDVSAVTYDEDIKEADLQLIDATMTLCDDALAGKHAAPTEGGQ
jgi:hypothetical protein